MSCWTSLGLANQNFPKGLEGSIKPHSAYYKNTLLVSLDPTKLILCFPNPGPHVPDPNLSGWAVCIITHTSKQVCVISETRLTARSVFGLVSRVSRVSSRDCRLSVRFPAVSSTFHSPRREIPSFIHSHTHIIVWGARETHSLERREEKLKDWMFIKVIVQPKKPILSSFTQASCHFKPVWVSFIHETKTQKEKFWRMLQ